MRILTKVRQSAESKIQSITEEKLCDKKIMKKALKILIIITFYAYCQISTLIFAGNSLEFIENRGQIVDMEGNLRPDILYVGDGGGAKIYLREGMVSYVMSEVEGLEEIEELKEEIEHERNEIEKKKKQEKLAALEANAKLKVHRVDMEFVNANINTSVRVKEPTQGYFNYYLGHCPEGITRVKAHRKVIYENMYPNIDVVFYGGIKEGMEYDFVVKPGGNVEDIRLRYKGAEGKIQDAGYKMQDTDGIEIKEGKLHIKTSLGEIKEEIPEVYQIIDGERVAIEAAYKLVGNEVKIVVGDYDKSKSLIIDPWITYYGGSNWEDGYGIATDGNGNVLITGETYSFDFPVSSGAFQTSFGGWKDAFVVKFEPAGSRLWATYYGGGDEDVGYGIATDGNNNVLITGFTWSSNFPVTGGAFQTSNAGAEDAFVVKFDSSGSQLWATYYGGSSYENSWGGCIATDGNDNVLITGYTWSNDFPVTAGAFQTTYAGSEDAFVVKLDGVTGDTLWATYYGGSSYDEGFGIVTDGSGNVLITGRTRSTNFPVTAGAFQMSKAGVSSGYDAFVVKLDTAGDMLWATYYGGSGNEEGYGIATDGSGNVLITGWTYSTDFPVTAGAFQTSNAGVFWNDAFVVKLDPAGDTLWATYLGGSSYDEGYGIAVDDSDNIFVGGDTYSTDFPATPCAFQTVKNGPAGTPYEDNCMVKFDPNGNLVCGTYLGGSEHDEMWPGENIAVYGGIVYMTGWTPGNYPVTSGAFQTSHGGGHDVWIAQLCDDCTMNCSLPLTINASAFPDTICKDSCINLSSSVAGGCGLSFSWTSIPPGFTSSAQDTVACPDTTTIYIVTIDDGDTTATDSVTVVVLPAPIVYLGADTTICAGDSVILDAGNPGFSYNWSTGENTQPITVNSAGTYWVVVDNGGCIEIDTINISVIPLPIAINDTSICAGDSIILDAGNPGATYLWSTGDTTRTITVDTPGTYWVEINDSGCIRIDTVVISLGTTLSVNLGADKSICAGDSIILDAGNPGASYGWSTGKSTQKITVNTVDTYWVKVDDGGCIGNDTININIKDCDTTENTFFIPNSFSPNDVGDNDILFVRSSGIKNIKLFIYNRWGEKVFETYDINKGWDGTFKRKKLNTDVFAWYAEVEFVDGDRIYRKGNVTLIK